MVFTPGFSGGSRCSIFNFLCSALPILFCLISFFFCPLYCLSFRITPVVSFFSHIMMIYVTTVTGIILYLIPIYGPVTTITRNDHKYTGFWSFPAIVVTGPCGMLFVEDKSHMSVFYSNDYMYLYMCSDTYKTRNDIFILLNYFLMR